MKHTPETKHRAMLLDFLERFLVRSRIDDDKQPRFLVCWALGHKGADIVTLMEDGSVRYNGSWKYSPEGDMDANVHELQSALMKMKNTKPKVQGCLARQHGINVNLGWKQTFWMSTDNSSLFRNKQLLDDEIRRRWKSVETS